jgi:hypothetical protein
MSWRCYKLVYEALSPIHIGYHTLGFVQRTRTYILGKNIWGAITEKLTKHLWPDKEGPYLEVGETVKQFIVPTYFYPAVEEKKPLFASSSPGEYPFNPLGEFEPLLVCSSAQTAIAPLNLGAEDGSLHETEYIASSVEGRQIFFIGYLFLKQDIEINSIKIAWDYGAVNLKEVISDLQVGGDRHYGFGKLSLIESPPEAKELFGCYQIESLSEDRPVIRNFKKNTPILAHLKIKGAKEIDGDIEPLVGFEWSLERGPGRSISKAEICWMPGSMVNTEQSFNICEYGLWEVH